MDHTKKVEAALNHQPGPIPLDIGATPTSGIHVSCVAELRHYYGLDKHPVKVIEPYQMLGLVEDDLLDALGVDVVGVSPRNTIFGFPNENWKEMRMPWGQVVQVSEHFQTREQSNGDLLIYPCGDRSASPSGHMPASSYFFDTIIRQEAIDDSALNVEDNLEEFGPISETDLDYFDSEIARLEDTGRAIVGNFGGTGLGDIALVPAPFLRHPKGIRDVEEWYISTLARQDYVHDIFARQTDIALKNLASLHARIGDRVQVSFICGTDFGTQNAPFCSPATFETLYLPYYRKVNNWIHQHTQWKTFKHSCGAIEPLLSLLIEAGFDIINPVQCSAEGMDAEALKRTYGGSLVFWGGGVDTQKTLPFGSVDEVKREVAERCRIFSEQGGFVFNTIHNIQALTPVANIVAVCEAVQEFNGSIQPE